MKFQFLLILLPLFILQCTTGRQHLYSEYEVEGNDCYAMCLIPQRNYVEVKEFVIYIGDETKEYVDITPYKIIIQEGGMKWEKKLEKNCVGNPDDCLVWCKVNIPEISRDVKILNDTIQSKNFEILKIEYPRTVAEHYASTKVVCQPDVTPELLHKIQLKLRAIGYISREKNVDQLDKKLSSDIGSFQIDNLLPSGCLNFETLEALGISLMD
ncbi:MAG: hypothetical protein R2774_08885 [Saprospiraceae bacterium]